MLPLNNMFMTITFVFLCAINSVLVKEIPHWTVHYNIPWGTLYLASYIQVCKRDPATLNNCVLNSIEALKPKLISGIPELDVPSIEPFIIPEIKALASDNTPVHASGHNIKVTGASAFDLKSLTVDPDTLTIKVRLRFPKLHFVGDYKVDTQLLALPLKGEGKIVADAIKCDAEVTIYPKIHTVDGVEYMKFRKVEANVNIKDYRIKLEGLFNGDKALGEAANQLINQNRGEFIKSSKPRLERQVAKIFLEISNKIVDGLSLEQVLPKP